MGSTTTHGMAAAAGLILVLGAGSTHAGAQVTVKGILYDDSTGVPLIGAVMLVDPRTDAAVVHTTTDSLGRFSLEARNGTYQIAAVRGGYASILSAPIPFENGERMTIRVPLSQAGDPRHRIGVLEHVRSDQNAVRTDAAEQTSAARATFRSRRLTGTGIHYDREKLNSANVATLGEFLMSVPGLDVIDPSSASSMQMTRNNGLLGAGKASPIAACHVGWYLDGHRVDMAGRTDPLTDALGSMQLDVVDAIEVFRGISEMPPEFAAPDLRCGAVAIWTRRE